MKISLFVLTAAAAALAGSHGPRAKKQITNAEAPKAVTVRAATAYRKEGTWPKLFSQSYLEPGWNRTDVTFSVVPSKTAEGKSCFRVFANVQIHPITDNANYRDFLSHLILFNTKSGLVEGKETGPLRPNFNKQNDYLFDDKELPSSKSSSTWRRPGFELVYIVTPSVHFGRVNLGCVTKVGSYNGVVEIKAKSDSPEKMSIPWSFEFRDGNIATMSYRLHEFRYPLPPGYTGAPYRPAKRGEHNQPPPRIPQYLTGSSDEDVENETLPHGAVGA
jgi:hypothetical protein